MTQTMPERDCTKIAVWISFGSDLGLEKYALGESGAFRETVLRCGCC